MINRQLIENIDWSLVALLFLNSGLGILIIFSSSHYLPGNYFLKQILWMALGTGALFLFLMIDYKILLEYSLHLYIAVTVILLGMLFFTQVIAGAKSWIRWKSFQVQPSEMAKIIIILVLARFFSEYKREFVSLGAVMLSSMVIALPFILVALQPDLGTAVSYLPLLLGALILTGLKKRFLAMILIFCVLLGVAAWSFYLQDYQKQRLTTMVFPGKDPQGSGYHLLQSKIAIGSGGLMGKGFKKGTQSQLKFLPARHTDFVFSVIGEEFGFLGVVVVLALYFLFLYRLFHSIAKSRDRAGIYLIFLVSLMITFQLLVNVAMVIGLFPIVGVPFPLLSYGGSSLFTTYLGVSLVLNVKMRRFANI